MAASIKCVLVPRTTSCTKSLCCSATFTRNASWSKFFRGSKPEDEEEKKEPEVRKIKLRDGPSTVSRLRCLKKKESVYSVRGYTPPPNVESKITSIASEIIGQATVPSLRLDDRLVKFRLLTKLMQEFDHPIGNTELSTMNTLEDVVNFFSTPVRDRSTYEDLTKLNLPKNLHIQMEPIRFDPETDTFFDGKTAFIDRPTIVTSLKYRRKYKGNFGESRNERSLTNYEKQQQLLEDYEQLQWKLK